MCLQYLNWNIRYKYTKNIKALQLFYSNTETNFQVMNLWMNNMFDQYYEAEYRVSVV